MTYLNSKIGIPTAPDLRVCKNTREMIIQQTEYQRSCFSIIVQELNDGRVINKNQNIDITKNTIFRQRAKGAIIVLSLLITSFIGILFGKVRAFFGL